MSQSKKTYTKWSTDYYMNNIPLGMALKVQYTRHNSSIDYNGIKRIRRNKAKYTLNQDQE